MDVVVFNTSRGVQLAQEKFLGKNMLAKDQISHKKALLNVECVGVNYWFRNPTHMSLYHVKIVEVVLKYTLRRIKGWDHEKQALQLSHALAWLISSLLANWSLVMT